MPFPTITDSDAQKAFRTLAEELGKLGAVVIELRDGLDRDWPDEMCNSEIPPSLSFWLHSQAEAFLVDYVKLGIELLRKASAASEETVRIDWQTTHPFAQDEHGLGKEEEGGAEDEEEER